MKRQSIVQRVKAAQKERDSLAGDKEAAEKYLEKERECLGAQSVLAQVLAAQAKVGGRAGGLAGELLEPACAGQADAGHAVGVLQWPGRARL